MYTRLISISFFIFSNISLAAEFEDQSVTSVVHWWSQPAEQSALHIIQTAFETEGGIWLDLGLPDYADARREVVDRLAYGYAPSVMQWNAGQEMIYFSDIGLLNTLPASAHVKDTQYYNFINDLVLNDQRQIAIPINIHTENWLWISKDIYDRFNFKPPNSWEELIEQMQTLADHGITPLAIGNEGWQLRVLFNNILIGKMGRIGYENFYIERKINHQMYGGLWQVLNIFMKLSQIQGNNKQDITWYEATNSVAEHRAAIQFMGDWAKGELLHKGLTPGKDFYCEFIPGTEGDLLHVFDVFLMGKNNKVDYRQSHNLLRMVMAKKQIQIDFNKAKGSVPVIQGLNPNIFDECSQKVMHSLEQSNDVLTPFALSAETEFTNRLYAVLIDLWKNPTSASVNISTNALIDLVNKSKL